MCGIAGVVGPGASRHRGVVEAMVTALGHRGPDGTGVEVFDDCVLGATRLAVVDVAGSPQPVRRHDGRAAVAFNGEVYGYRRLRAASRFPFRTQGDTEVLLALHEAHGAGFVERLPGMFAYALWDDRRGRLECGRDRFGEKPFFWLRGPDGAMAFASEVKALRVTGWLDPVVDDMSLAHVVAHGFVPPARSIYRDVAVLAPAHRMSVRPGGDPRILRYWTPPPRRRRIDPTAAAVELADRLDQAVADQLEADVPVGALLSGGLDSSSVVATAADRPGDLHTFSFGLGGPDDETEHARRQAAHAGTTHHAHTLGGIDPVAFLRSLPAIYDEPFADASAVPTVLLSRAVREVVTVALTGDGADELFGGYLHWARHHLVEQGVPLPRSLGGPGAARRDRGRLLAAYRGFRRYATDGHLRALGLGDAYVAPRYGGVPRGTVADLLRYDLDGYLPGDILVKTDRASMAAGLELRSPFLDRGVAEWALSLPEEVLVGPTGDKLVLRSAMRDRLAAGVTERDKLGFSGPLAPWLAEPAVQELAHEVVAAPGARLHDLVDPGGVAPFVGGDGQGSWNLLTLGLWAEAYPDARRR